MNPLRVTIAWLDAIACFATAAAVVAYYGLGIDHFEFYGVTISLVQHGKYIAIIYIALEMLSAALGEGGNNPLYWLSYLASATACLVITLVAVWACVGMQGKDPAIIQLLAVPYASALLITLFGFSWFSLLLLQGHKHSTAWEHITSARGIVPPAPVPPTIPAAVAPAVPGSAASLVIVLLLLCAIVVGAVATLGGGGIRFAFNRAADTDHESVAAKGEKDCPIKSRTQVGEMKNGAPIYVIEPGDC